MRRWYHIELTSWKATAQRELNRKDEAQDYAPGPDATLRMPLWSDSLLFLFAVVLRQLNELLILLALAGRHIELRMSTG
jgi:hypothetical protein